MAEMQKSALAGVDLACGSDEPRKVLGTGMAKVGNVESEVVDSGVRIVPSVAFRNFRNTGSGMLKLFATYRPLEFAPGTGHTAAALAGE